MINLNFRSPEVEDPDHMSEIVYVNSLLNRKTPKIGVVTYKWAEYDVTGDLTGNFKKYEEDDPGANWGVIAFVDDQLLDYDIKFIPIDEWNEAFKEVI